MIFFITLIIKKYLHWYIMSFWNRVGNGASMSNSVDIVANSISLIQPDGSLQTLTIGGTVAPVNAPTFTGTVGGIYAASVAELALHK